MANACQHSTEAGDGELINQDYVVEVKVIVAYIMRCCLKATKQKTYYVYSWQI